MYARGSLAEHLPNPVSPLFGTFGLRLANVATGALGTEFLGTEACNDYQYRTINGYVYLGIVFGPKEMWKFTKAGISQIGMMLGKGTERWQDARRRLIDAGEHMGSQASAEPFLQRTADRGQARCCWRRPCSTP